MVQYPCKQEIPLSLLESTLSFHFKKTPCPSRSVFCGRQPDRKQPLFKSGCFLLFGRSGKAAG